uniref:Uncharacterized protein n=1 Tax=Leifsonia xyli subsp. xyli TaxID=59736 RepID=Q7X3M7_LEIXY|nr:hypothetical protein [Leifsonia xyli subsp. xyli]
MPPLSAPNAIATASRRPGGSARRRMRRMSARDGVRCSGSATDIDGLPRSQHEVGRVCQSLPVTHDEHGHAVCREPAQRVHEALLGAGVERGGRLVQQQHREQARAQPVERAGDGDALGLPAGEPGSAGPDDQLRVELVRRRVGERPGDRVRVRHRCSERDVLRDRPGEEPRKLTRPRDAVPPSRSVCSPGHSDRAAVRDETERRGQKTRLARAARCAQHGQRARLHKGGERADDRPALVGHADFPEFQTGDGRAGWRFAPGLPRRIEDREGSGGRFDPLCRRVVAGADIPQRQVRLRGEKQHEQPRREVERTVEEPQADRHGDEGDGETGGQLEDEAREERHAQNAHGPLAVLIRDCQDAAGLPVLTAEEFEGREPLDDLEESAGEPGQRIPLLLLRGLRRPADEHHEDRDERERADEDDAAREVLPADHEHQGWSRDDGEDELREVFGEVTVERLHPPPGDEGDIRAVAPGHPSRSLLADGSHEPVSQLSDDRRAPSRGGGFGQPEQSGAADHRQRERREERAELRGRRSRDGADDELGDQPGERHSSDGLRQREETAHGEGRARRGGVAEQAGIEGTHATRPPVPTALPGCEPG